jgi:hypothetical protein
MTTENLSGAELLLPFAAQLAQEAGHDRQVRRMDVQDGVRYRENWRDDVDSAALHPAMADATEGRSAWPRWRTVYGFVTGAVADAVTARRTPVA